MASTAKTLLAVDTSGLLDGTPADASDVATPVRELLAYAKQGSISASHTDTHIKPLSDALGAGGGITKAILNAGANEQIQLQGATAIVPFTVLGFAAAAIAISAIPPTYDHLRLVLGIRTFASALVDDLRIQCNGDTSILSYASLSANIQHNGSLTTTQSLEGTVSGGQLKNAVTAGTSPAGYMGVLYIDIYEYAQIARPRIARWSGLVRVGTSTGQTRLVRGGFMWKNTANAISSLAIASGSGFALAPGSGYGLYGIR